MTMNVILMEAWLLISLNMSFPILYSINFWLMYAIQTVFIFIIKN